MDHAELIALEEDAQDQQKITRAVATTTSQGGALAEGSPAGIMLTALSRGVPPSDIREMLALQREWDADQARKLHAKAMAGFKSEAVRVVRNVTIKDGPLKGKKHADLFAVTDAATEALSKYGLSATFRVVQDDRDWIKIACCIKHEAGHVEETQFGGPIDAGPGRNAIQARKSTVTYLERITLLLALGLSESDADDDGALGGGKPGATTPPPPPAQAFYAAEGFAKNFPAWSELILSGKKTADQIIAVAETKAPLSDKQKADLRAVAA